MPSATARRSAAALPSAAATPPNATSPVRRPPAPRPPAPRPPASRPAADAGHDAAADWRAAAACAGLPPHVVFSRRPAVAAPALRACARCPVRRRCEETVAPAESWFDGVSAGRLWRNGRPVTPRRPRTTARRQGRKERS
ncbi:WhiB family transcriptional regulator [Streptomyces sp. NPDC047928]|uniref:WhiB family transcriptional regulator n=1 Tax=unclassified Streptomyces TaxID=2593676 RepID=UPI003722B0A7